jgi:hypothetical protein
MSDDDDSSQAASAAGPEAPDPAPGSQQGWREQDRRTLIISIASGLAANLGTVVLVGAALAFVHMGHGTRRRYTAAVQVFVSLAAIAFGIILLVRAAPRWRVFVGGLVVYRGGLAGAAGGVLIVTGLAAGVK